MTRIVIVQLRTKCPLERQCCTVALGSLTTPTGTSKDPQGEIKQSRWPLPIWCPQEISVLVLMAWSLGRKGSSPSWSTGSNTPHPRETCSSHTELQLERLHSSPARSKPELQRHGESFGRKWPLRWLGEDGEPALGPKNLHLRHQGHIRAFARSASSTAA